MAKDSVDVVSFLNEEQPELLLLLAWNLFKRKNAATCSIGGVDANGMTINVSYGSSKPVEHIAYSFPNRPLADQSTIKSTIAKLFLRHSGAVLPNFVEFAIMSLLWLLLLAGAAGEADLIKYNILSILQPYVLVLFRAPANAMVVLILTIIAHVLEAIYVAYLCNVMGLAQTSMMTWFGLVLYMGYPTTIRVVQLAHVAKRKKLRYA